MKDGKDIVDVVSSLQSEFSFLTLPKQSDLCFYCPHSPLSSFVKLSVKVSKYGKQEDSSWRMTRWTGGGERFICLWDKGRGRRGKLSYQGEKKTTTRHGYVEWYKEKRLAEKWCSLVLCVFTLYRLVDQCTTQAKGLANSLSKYVLSTQYVLDVAPCPEVVRLNKTPNFLSEKSSDKTWNFLIETFQMDSISEAT